MLPCSSTSKFSSGDIGTGPATGGKRIPIIGKLGSNDNGIYLRRRSDTIDKPSQTKASSRWVCGWGKGGTGSIRSCVVAQRSDRHKLGMASGYGRCGDCVFVKL